MFSAIEAPGSAKILEGFEKSVIPLSISKIYPPPAIPINFRGQHGLISPNVDDALKESETNVVPEPRTGFRPHTAASRNEVLSGPRTSSDVASVFDLIPANQKTRIPLFQKASEEGKRVVDVAKPAPSVKTAELPPPKPTVNTVSVEEQRKHNLALFAGSVTFESKMTFQPFEKEPEKQRRYDLFLRKRNDRNKGLSHGLNMINIALFVRRTPINNLFFSQMRLRKCGWMSASV